MAGRTSGRGTGPHGARVRGAVGRRAGRRPRHPRGGARTPLLLQGRAGAGCPQDRQGDRDRRVPLAARGPLGGAEHPGADRRLQRTLRAGAGADQAFARARVGARSDAVGAARLQQPRRPARPPRPIRRGDRDSSARARPCAQGRLSDERVAVARRARLLPVAHGGMGRGARACPRGTGGQDPDRGLRGQYADRDRSRARRRCGSPSSCRAALGSGGVGGRSGQVGVRVDEGAHPPERGAVRRCPPRERGGARCARVLRRRRFRRRQDRDRRRARGCACSRQVRACRGPARSDRPDPGREAAPFHRRAGSQVPCPPRRQAERPRLGRAGLQDGARPSSGSMG